MAIICKLREIAAVSLFSVCTLSNAATIHLAGDTVDFYYDDAQPGMSSYGPLSSIGNSIFAQSVNLSADATNGSSTSVSALGTITIVAQPGYSFSFIHVAQLGDYSLNGAGASIDVSGTLSIEDSINSSTSFTNTLSISGLGINDGLTHEWQASSGFDLSTATWSNVTSIELSLDTLLSATTLISGESAFTESKFVGGGMVTIETSAVPVPAAIWLFGSGLLGLASIARRSNKRIS